MPTQPERPPLGERFDRRRYARAYVESGFTSSEAAVQDEIVRALRTLGVLVWAIDAGGKSIRAKLHARGLVLADGGLSDAPPGFPDLSGVCLDGVALFVEVKRPGIWDRNGKIVQIAGKPSSDQSRFIKAARARGARAGFAWSIEDALEIAGLGEGRRP